MNDIPISEEPSSVPVTLAQEIWSKHAGNPVLVPGPPGSWDDRHVVAGSVLYEGSAYKMWYAGCTSARCQIGYATSADGVNWTKYSGNPVLGAGPGAWEPTIGNPCVISDGGTYRMWYTGDQRPPIRIGYATSPDGVAWTKFGGNPVLVGTPSSWDGGAVSTPVVIREGASFTMWYSGHSGDYTYRIGRATSPDGGTWTKDAANPLMSPQLAWEIPRVHPFSIFSNATGYEMYYTGAFTYVQFGHATSPDGRTWTRDLVTPILSPGTPGEWDGASLSDSSVVDMGTHRRMWYSGNDGSTWRIGLAETPYTPPEEPKPCPHSHGYWKNHADAWPVDALDLGSRTYGKDEVLALLRAPSRGDASLILAHQLIAAKLNLAHGSDPAPVEDAIDDADALLAAHAGRLPFGVPPSSPEGHAMTGIAEVLDDYNNGLLTPDCEPAGMRPEPREVGGTPVPVPGREAQGITPPAACACYRAKTFPFPA